MNAQNATTNTTPTTSNAKEIKELYGCPKLLDGRVVDLGGAPVRGNSASGYSVRLDGGKKNRLTLLKVLQSFRDVGIATADGEGCLGREAHVLIVFSDGTEKTYSKASALNRFFGYVAPASKTLQEMNAELATIHADGQSAAEKTWEGKEAPVVAPVAPKRLNGGQKAKLRKLWDACMANGAGDEASYEALYTYAVQVGAHVPLRDDDAHIALPAIAAVLGVEYSEAAEELVLFYTEETIQKGRKTLKFLNLEGGEDLVGYTGCKKLTKENLEAAGFAWDGAHWYMDAGYEGQLSITIGMVVEFKIRPETNWTLKFRSEKAYQEYIQAEEARSGMLFPQFLSEYRDMAKHHAQLKKASDTHDCYANVVHSKTDGPLGDAYHCGVCGTLLQVG